MLEGPIKQAALLAERMHSIRHQTRTAFQYLNLLTNDELHELFENLIKEMNKRKEQRENAITRTEN